MMKPLIRAECAIAALLALTSAVSAMPAGSKLPQPVVHRMAYRHHAHRHGLQQPDPGYERQVPTGGGDYGGPDTAFPVGENSAVRPGGSYAITAPSAPPPTRSRRNNSAGFAGTIPRFVDRLVGFPFGRGAMVGLARPCR